MHELDCFAELVIGPTTSGWARWLAMARIVRELTICDAADDAKLEALEALVAHELPASENSATFKCGPPKRATSAFAAPRPWSSRLPRRHYIRRPNWVDSVEKVSKVVAYLPKHERHLRLTLITAADRFRTCSIEFEVDYQAPASASENRTHGAEKIGLS